MGLSDISFLRAFVATQQQYNQRPTIIREVHPVTLAMVDPSLMNTFANRFHVGMQTALQFADRTIDSGLGDRVTKAEERLLEGACVVHS